MNFLDLGAVKSSEKTARAVLFPVPLAEPAQNPVPDRAPEAILQASARLSSYDAETDTDFKELSVATLQIAWPERCEEALELVYAQAVPHFKHRRLVAGVSGSVLLNQVLLRAALACHTHLSVLHLGARPRMEPPLPCRTKRRCQRSSSNAHPMPDHPYRHPQHEPGRAHKNPSGCTGICP